MIIIGKGHDGKTSKIGLGNPKIEKFTNFM